MSNLHRRANARTVSRLGLVVVAMFAFGYALVPIYDVLCDLTGLNGKTGRVAATEAGLAGVDESRSVTVEFIATRNQNLGMEFAPEVTKMRVHPGQVYETYYVARNVTGEELVVQAAPSVTPPRAATHFNKVECFCFTQQKFAEDEERKMPVRFIVERGLAPNIDTVSLSYTLFDVTRTAMN